MEINRTLPPIQQYPVNVGETPSSKETSSAQPMPFENAAVSRLVGAFLQRSPDCDPSLRGYTLDEWLLHTFLKLLKVKDFPLTKDLAMVRLQEVLNKTVKQNHGFTDVFGPNVNSCSITDNLNILFYLAKQHDYFGTKIGTLCSFAQADDPLKEPLTDYLEGIELYAQNVHDQIIAVDRIVKIMGSNYQLFKEKLSKNKKTKKIYEQIFEIDLADQIISNMQKKLGPLKRFDEARLTKVSKVLKLLKYTSITAQDRRAQLKDLSCSILSSMSLINGLKSNFIKLVEEMKAKNFLLPSEKEEVLKQSSFTKKLKPVKREEQNGSDNKKIIAKQKHFGQFLGGQKNYVMASKEAFALCTQLKDSLKEINTSPLKWLCNRIDAYSRTTDKGSNDSYFETYWLELMNEHSEPPHVKTKKSLAKIKTITTPTVCESDEESEILPKEETKMIFSKQEILFQQGEEILSRSETKAISHLTEISDYIGSLLLNSLTSDLPRVAISQKESRDRLFLGACAFEVFFQGAVQGGLTACLSSFRSLVMNWHLQLEQAMLGEHLSKGNDLPNSHLLEEIMPPGMDPQDLELIKDLNNGLIWSRYPYASVRRYQQRPELLNWIVTVDEWIDQLLSGKSMSDKDRQLFAKWVEVTTEMHKKVQTCLLNILKRRNLDPNLISTATALQEKWKKLLHIDSSSIPTKLFKELVQPDEVISKLFLKEGNSSVHLLDAIFHLKRVSLVERCSVATHLEAWKEGQLMYLQWVIEEIFKYLCRKNGFGFIQEHHFSAFTELLQDYSMLNGTPCLVTSELLKKLDPLNFRKGVYYPHLVTAYLKEPSLNRWLSNLQISRHALHNPNWSQVGQKKRSLLTKEEKRDGMSATIELIKKGTAL